MGNRKGDKGGKPITVLFVTHSSNLSGANRSLVDLVTSVRNFVNPIVLFPSHGPAIDLFSLIGAKCIICPYERCIKAPVSLSRKVVILTHPWRFRFIKHLRTLIIVRKVLKDGVPDIVHSNTSLTTIGIYLSRMFRAKHVWHIREQWGGGHFHTDNSNWKKQKQKIEKAQARIVVSESCMKKWELKSESTYLFFDAVCKISDSILLDSRQSYVLFCSNFITEAKGANIAIQAFRLSGLAEKGIRLKIVGRDIGFNKSLMLKAEELGCIDAVDFIPYQDDVKQLFAKALAFINPSSNEGLGRTTEEAMFFGCPVIGLASGGTMDLINNGETGYLFSSIEECADLLMKVCTTDQHNIIKRAQEFAQKELSIDGYGDKIMKVYQEVLNVQDER